MFKHPIFDGVRVVNIGNNHWVSIVVNFSKQSVLAGNSQPSEVEGSVVTAFNWFANLVHMGTYNFYRLPSTQQLDANSCGLMAVNAVAHHVSNGHEPLMGSSFANVVLVQMRMMYHVLYHHWYVSDCDFVIRN